MTLAASSVDHDLVLKSHPVEIRVIEEPRLYTESVWDEKLRTAVLELRIRPGHAVDPKALGYAMAQVRFPVSVSAPALVRASSTRSWNQLAHEMFADSRYFTVDEQEEFDRMSRGGARPLSRPVKKLR